MFFIHKVRPLNFSYYTNRIEEKNELCNVVKASPIVNNKYTKELLFRTNLDFFVYLRDETEAYFILMDKAHEPLKDQSEPGTDDSGCGETVLRAEIKENDIEMAALVNMFMGSLLLGYIRFDVDKMCMALSRIEDDFCNFYCCFFIDNTVDPLFVKEPWLIAGGDCYAERSGECNLFSGIKEVDAFTAVNKIEEVFEEDLTVRSRFESLNKISLRFIEDTLSISINGEKEVNINKLINTIKPADKITNDEIETSEIDETPKDFIRYGRFIDGRLNVARKRLNMAVGLDSLHVLANFAILVLILMETNSYDVLEVTSNVDILFVKKESDVFIYLTDVVSKKDLQCFRNINGLRSMIKAGIEAYEAK